MAGSMLPPLILELFAKTGEFKAGMAEAGHSVEGFRAKSDGATRLAGKAIAGMGLAYVGAAALMVKGAANFQTSQERLVTSAGESQKNLAGVSSGIEQMAGQVGDTVQQLSTGMYTAESAGFHGAAGLTVLKAAAQGAKAENADLSTVTNALTDVLVDYHMKASDSAKVTSQMVTATSLGKTTFEAFSGAFGNVMPLAASAHLKFGEIAADLSQFTNHGISADQASQEMANSIRSLQSPTLAMTKSMAGYGVNAQDVAHKLSQRGLAGTMQYLSQTILHQMGPSGMVLQQVMNTSKAAAQDANTMYEHLPTSLTKLADAYKSGSVTQLQWTKDLKGQTPQNASLLRQWATMQNTSHGFAQTLKSGGPAARTYSSALAAVTGTSNGLNTALMLTGENTKAVNDAIHKVSGATSEAGGNVKGWSVIQGTFNQQMSRAWASLDALGVMIGTDLLPLVTSAAKTFTGWIQVMERHKGTVETLAKIIGGVLGGAFALYAAAVVTAKVKAAAAMAADIAKGVWWVATKAAHYVAVAASAVASAATTTAAWLANGAVMVGKAVAQGAVWLASTVAHFVAAAAAATVNAAAATASWLANGAVMVGEAVAKGAVWLAATIAQYVAAAASAVVSAATTAAAWIAANLAMIVATGGILLAVGLLVAGGIYLYTHWHQVWGDIKRIVGDVWSWMQGVFHDIENWFTGVISADLSAFQSVWGAVWSGIQTVVQGVWSVVQPIFSGISSAVSTITSGISSLSSLGHTASGMAHALHIPGFDVGGFVPGPAGKPMLAIVHGGEYVLTPDMQAGRTEPKGLTGSPGSLGAQRFTSPTGTAPGSTASLGAPAAAAGHTVNVYTQTNADPHQIATEVGWQLRMAS